MERSADAVRPSRRMPSTRQPGPCRQTSARTQTDRGDIKNVRTNVSMPSTIHSRAPRGAQFDNKQITSIASESNKLHAVPCTQERKKQTNNTTAHQSSIDVNIFGRRARGIDAEKKNNGRVRSTASFPRTKRRGWEGGKAKNEAGRIKTDVGTLWRRPARRASRERERERERHAGSSAVGAMCVPVRGGATCGVGSAPRSYRHTPSGRPSPP